MLNFTVATKGWIYSDTIYQNFNATIYVESFHKVHTKLFFGPMPLYYIMVKFQNVIEFD